jgi:hypothetical protein
MTGRSVVHVESRVPPFLDFACDRSKYAVLVLDVTDTKAKALNA